MNRADMYSVEVRNTNSLCKSKPHADVIMKCLNLHFKVRKTYDACDGKEHCVSHCSIAVLMDLSV